MSSLIALESSLQWDAALRLRKHNQIPTIAPLIGSSDYEAISDDALKDEDNAGWVMHLEAVTRQEWIERIHWIRLADRLAECEFICSEKTEFQTFVASWHTLHRTGQVDLRSPYRLILQAMHDRWFARNSQPLQNPTIQAWNKYLLALKCYNAPDFKIQTCEDYEQMLASLAGAFFQVLPHLPDHYRRGAYYLGIVDQFYNHVRDLQEDCAHGICYLPTELLDGFGVSREEMLQQQAPQNPNYTKMMQFWLNDYLPRLRSKAWHFRGAHDLPLSWQILNDWSWWRYQRIEQAFRACQFDYTCFPTLYWPQVREELPIMLSQVRSLKELQGCSTDWNHTSSSTGRRS